MSDCDKCDVWYFFMFDVYTIRLHIRKTPSVIISQQSYNQSAKAEFHKTAYGIFHYFPALILAKRVNLLTGDDENGKRKSLA